MLRIGITGGIGSGKSAVCGIFEFLGIPVYNADIRARYLVENEPELRDKLIQEFGPQTYIESKYNRDYISSIVFNDKSKLEKLNAIIHPFVFNDWEDFCITHQSAPYVIKEAAIMLETESRYTVDRIVLVYAPLELRIERVLNRDAVNRESVLKRIHAQMPDEEKLPLADYVILNDGEHALIEQVLQLHNEFISDKI